MKGTPANVTLVVAGGGCSVPHNSAPASRQEGKTVFPKEPKGGEKKMRDFWAANQEKMPTFLGEAGTHALSKVHVD